MVKCESLRINMFRITHTGKSVNFPVTKPRCFNGVRNLPCRYRAQNKSWMDSQLFEDWVREQDRKFEREGRKVALVVDNCPAHQMLQTSRPYI